MPRPRNLRGGEALEVRQLLAIVGVPWQDPRHLTFSFVPDGTPIAGHESSLFEALGETADPDAWQADIARALQTWAVHGNIDFGIRADGGQPLGVAGKLQRDPRFGDLRFAAQPMVPTSLAIAVLHDPFLSGTLAGDVLFNSNANFAAAQTDLFSVALHEIGHALGLDDSDDPTSVMFHHAGNNLTSLGPSDIAALRALYGWRAPDANDLALNNGTLAAATGIRFPTAQGEYTGATPLVVYGDVRNAYDLDYFRLPPLADYQGPVTVRLQSEGVSLLKPRLQIYDAAGAVLYDQDALHPLGNVISVTLAEVDPAEPLYFRVSGATSDVFGVGRYGLAVTYDARVEAAAYVLDELLIGPYESLNETEIRELFEHPHDGFVREDYYGNDTLATATVLTTTLGYAAHTHYEAIGSVSMAADVDIYRVEAPFAAEANNVLTATVAEMPLNGAHVHVALLDAAGNDLGAEVLANGNGVYTVQAQGLASHGVYYVKVTGMGAPAEHGSDMPPVLGNYTLTAAFGTRAAEIETFAEGRFNRPFKPQSVMLYVAEDQLFHFLLAASARQSHSLEVEMRLIDAGGEVLLTMVTRGGEPVSAAAQHIYPGAYRLEFRNLSRQAGPVEFSLRGGRLSKPVGPAIEDPTLEPLFRDDSDPTLFRYPGDILSPEPVLFVVLPTLPLLPGLNSQGGGSSAQPTTQRAPAVLAPVEAARPPREALVDATIASLRTDWLLDDVEIGRFKPAQKALPSRAARLPRPSY